MGNCPKWYKMSGKVPSCAANETRRMLKNASFLRCRLKVSLSILDQKQLENSRMKKTAVNDNWKPTSKRLCGEMRRMVDAAKKSVLSIWFL